MKRISEFASDIEVAIRGLNLDGRKPESLYAPIAYAMSAGGKRLRPVITLMSAETFGASEDTAILPAIGMEMFHNFTLLHDDVMDKSDTRRGRPTVHAKWNSDVAILSGDTMLTLAEELISNVDDAILPKVSGLFHRKSIEVYEGQALDMDFEKRERITVEEYLEMVRLKTGALLGACAGVGAIIGGADESAVGKMIEFGEMLGIAFQIEDDRLDTFGDAVTFGKPIGGDINNGKKSFLLTFGLNSGTPDAKALEVAMMLEPGELRVRTVTRIYEKMGMPEICRKAVGHYSTGALHALKSAGLNEAQIEPFKVLIDKLTGRKK